ncbi:hypothetical protein J2T17_004372 [Paenibacillus mucilaginosus]|uniref:hypothetical protein n=1 Tax=Paenibacillus mucilaginosus TaxID=61624 RepID=UPI003D257BD8
MQETIVKIHVFLDPAIRSLLVIGISLAMVLLLGQFLFPLKKAYLVVRFKGLPTTVETQKSSDKRHAKWARHLILLNRSISSSDRSDDELLQRFLILSGGSFAITYFAYGFWIGLFSDGGFQWQNLFDRWLVIVSLMAGAMPYAIMRIKLHRVRVKNSYDLIPAVNTLIMKYEEYRGNLYYAVFETSKGLKGDILNAFVGLLPALQGASNSNIDDAIELFIFRIKTTWAIQLGILIHKSEEQGDDIEQGMRWLIADMSEVSKITEELKSENRETMQMAYLGPILLPIVIYLNQYPSMGKSWHYYFQTTPGIKMLVFTVLFTALVALIAYTLQKPRNEV